MSNWILHSTKTTLSYKFACMIRSRSSSQAGSTTCQLCQAIKFFIRKLHFITRTLGSAAGCCGYVSCLWYVEKNQFTLFNPAYSQHGYIMIFTTLCMHASDTVVTTQRSSFSQHNFYYFAVRAHQVLLLLLPVHPLAPPNAHKSMLIEWKTRQWAGRGWWIIEIIESFILLRTLSLLYLVAAAAHNTTVTQEICVRLRRSRRCGGEERYYLLWILEIPQEGIWNFFCVLSKWNCINHDSYTTMPLALVYV